MSTYTQSTRRIAIDTPLGKDVLLLDAFTGREEISRLFTYDVQLLSQKEGIAAKDIVGKNVTFSVQFADGSKRYFNGHVQRFAYLGKGDRLHIYRAQVVPWLWFLTRRSNCRIFQKKSVPDIIKQVFSDAGFTQFSTDIQGTHQPWEYCVQYRETDFNFVSRLMEHEGIFYYHKHEQGKHTLVLADHKGTYKDCKEKEVEMRGPLSGPGQFNSVVSWEHQHEFRSGKWSQTDYNFETPSTSLLVNTNTQVKLDGNDKLEFYDYPGEYEKKADGDADNRLRMEEEEAGYDTVTGESICRSFSPGFKFKLTKHPAKSEEGKGYAITAVYHSASGGSTFASGGDQVDSYSNHFTCIPDNIAYRPPRTTPKPMVHGAQTAVVVGPQGEEIYPDKYGRVKVQFYWDREGKRDENSSCWIRVAQLSAGKGWGAMSIPRVGQEVVVTYLEGDPDRPLITGVVYNAEQMPPYALPDEKTKSYIKTNSTMGGSGFNEIRIDDKKDKEQIFIHAQKNMDTRVLNDSMQWTRGNSHHIVGYQKDKAGDQRELVYQDKHLNVKRHQVEQIEGNLQMTVGHGEAQGGNFDLLVAKDFAESVEGNRHLTVTSNRNEKVGGTQSLTVSQNQYEKVGMAHALEAGQTRHIKAGMTLVIEAGMQISL